MAKLHRRAHRLPHPGLIAFALALAVLVPAGIASAQSAGAEDEAVGRSGNEVDALLARLRRGDAAERRAAAQAVVDSIERSDLPAVRERLLAPLPVAPEVLRFRMIAAVERTTAGRPNADYDLLNVLLAQPRSADMDAAVERVTLARAVGRIPTADAGRALVALAGAHGAAFRSEVSRIVRNQLRDYVLPALIELRNPSDGMRIFTRQVRETLRRVTPGETVQQHDNALLAEVLRAYASMHQPDAMKVVVSFVNSDRAQVREAARWGVAQYGREAIIALREAYEMYEGTPPNPLWGWERTARELYAANDRHRDEEVATALDAGIAAGRAGRHEEMVAHFRHVLARHPLFERRTEMVAPLVDYARALERQDAAHAEGIYRMALWVDPDGPRARSIRGDVLFLEAERALARGVADPELYRAVLRVDPGHSRARAQLEQVEQADVLRARRRRRLFGAAGLFVLAAAVLWFVTREREWGRCSKIHTSPKTEV